MLRSLTAFETAFDRMAGGYFLVLAIALAGAVAGVTL
ncbi:MULTISPECIES: hypothetical protein [unclassified Caulobacter]|nr:MULTISPECIES: hypothetical protein [unclassified Caulobacter]